GDAVDKSVRVSDLLRKAKIAAVKLGLKDSIAWVEHELNGYSGNAEIPEYRKVYGSPRGFNPYRGWEPILFTGDPKTQELISSFQVGMPVSELEHLSEGEGQLTRPFPPQVIQTLCDHAGWPVTQMALFIGKDKIIGILDTVRTKVLDWALALEAAGVKGEGLSFSTKEKEVVAKAQTTFNIGSIGNFSGSLGTVGGDSTVVSAQFVQAHLGELRSIIEQVKALRGHLGLMDVEAKKLDASLAEIERELKKEKPDGGTLRRIFGSLRTIAEGAAGSVVGQGIINLIDKIPWG
ncbi:MAG: hypothetical protein KIT16_18350, partial [Rhodospirillaceae bacterium]|nr:hypothetical protein [Rhodospirillaceae bacterium]